jgi:hypothetical protein
MDTTSWVLIITTICTGIGTVLTAIAAFQKSKGETRTQAEADCMERLADARRDAASMADEIWQQRLKRLHES